MCFRPAFTGRPHVRRHFCCKNHQKAHKSYTIMIPGQFTSFLKIIQLSYCSITRHRLAFSLGSRTHVSIAWRRPGQDTTPYVLLPMVKGNLIRFLSRLQIMEKLWLLQHHMPLLPKGVSCHWSKIAATPAPVHQQPLHQGISCHCPKVSVATAPRNNLPLPQGITCHSLVTSAVPEYCIPLTLSMESVAIARNLYLPQL